MDLKRAFSSLAASAAPAIPDIDRAVRSAPPERLGAAPGRPRAGAWRLRALAYPIAAALAVTIGTALALRWNSRSPARPDPDYLLSSARSQAALSVGLPSSSDETDPESSSVESDILDYLESLWSPPAPANGSSPGL